MHLKYLFVLCLIFPIKLQAQVTPEKPNIIFIVADDLNDYIEDLNGNSQITTPNISRIADNGTLFTNAFCSSPLCCPSRTAFLTGKGADYTKIYSAVGYKCGNFSQIFSIINGNEEYFTIPGYLKDSAGYFTYSLNKIFHCYENLQEYDDETPDGCAKSLSWNKIFAYNDTGVISPITVVVEEGLAGNEWSAINDTLEPYMMDYIAVDSTIKFIQQVAAGEDIACHKPFFIALGLKKPHKPVYIPEKYFAGDYIKDFYLEPYNISYNDPNNAYPTNGVVMAPQPEVPFSDYFNLPAGGLAQSMVAGADDKFEIWATNLDPLPTIDPLLTDEERLEILAWSKRANLTIAYMAAVKYIDAQIGRLLDSLENYPALYNNTVIIFISDNGFSLSEKKHWGKRALWETDERVPMIISDLRSPVEQTCHRTVNLLDLFPTICDIADVEHPVFSDGTNYLDGQSLLPLLNNTEMSWICPVLSTVKKEYGTEGSCFPQYSVRDEKYHYIRYQSNGGVGFVCDEASSYFEEEFYEIGINRETDPNEWNNLISNDDYIPVINYLKEFLPEGSMYLQKAFEVRISTKTLPCFINDHTFLKLNSTLFSDDGALIAGAELTNYQFKWTNNLTPAIYFGKNYIFNTATIPTAEFAANEKILFYLEITDLTSGQMVAFNTKTIYINVANTPTSDFALINGVIPHSVNITDYTISGSYRNTYWTFGDGTSSEEFMPDTHYYPAAGGYIVKNYIEYGNGCTKSKAHSLMIFHAGTIESGFTLYPNPANNYIQVKLEEQTADGNLQIINILGEVVLSQNLDARETLLHINTTSLPAGTYIININTENKLWNKKFDIIR